MKIKSTIIVLFSILIVSNLAAQDSYTKLQQKIDSLETKLGKVNCSSLFLFVATGGYEATRRLPECKGGKQTFNVELRPD